MRWIILLSVVFITSFVITGKIYHMKNDIVNLTLDLQQENKELNRVNEHLTMLYSEIKKLDYQLDVLSSIIHDRKQ